MDFQNYNRETEDIKNKIKEDTKNAMKFKKASSSEYIKQTQINIDEEI